MAWERAVQRLRLRGRDRVEARFWGMGKGSVGAMLRFMGRVSAGAWLRVMGRGSAGTRLRDMGRGNNAKTALGVIKRNKVKIHSSETIETKVL